MTEEDEGVLEENPSSRYYRQIADILFCKDCWRAWGTNEGLCPKHKKWLEGVKKYGETGDIQRNKGT